MLLASGSADYTIRLWDSATGGVRQVLQAHNRTVQAIAFRSNGQMLVSGDDDGHLLLWQPTSGDALQWLQTKLGEIPGGVTTLAFSPDGALLAGAGPDHTIFLWRMMNAAIFATLQTPVHSTVYALAFNPTCAGNRLELVSSSGNGAICCWEIEQATGVQRLRYVYKEHQRSVRILLFTPDGQTFISGSADETIKVWDVKTGDCLATLNLEQPYQGMNITGAIGLTPAQQTALKALGANDCG